MAQHNPFIDAILAGREPNVMDFLRGPQSSATPGINPAAPPIPRPAVGPQAKPKSGIEGLLNNKFLLNLLAQSGSSLTPGPSPIGAIGRAGIATQQQNLQEKLFESRIGVNQQKAAGVGASSPLSSIGKINADEAAGLVTPEVAQAKRNEILTGASNIEFANTQKLRGEFIQETKGISSSLSSLSAARALIETDANPIAQFAAFISTIKSIDNSTVREGELRAFEKVQGLRRELDNFLKRAKGEGMTVDLRKDIAETINKLQEPLNELLDRRRRFYGNEAKRFKLNPESVSGSPFSTVGEAQLPDQDAVVPPDVTPSNIDAQIAALDAEAADIDRQLEEARREARRAASGN